MCNSLDLKLLPDGVGLTRTREPLGKPRVDTSNTSGMNLHWRKNLTAANPVYIRVRDDNYQNAKIKTVSKLSFCVY